LLKLVVKSNTSRDGTALDCEGLACACVSHLDESWMASAYKEAGQ